MRKADLIPAIKSLISGYDQHSNEHLYSSCPLCQVSVNCGNCINVVFSTKNSSTPCYQRCQAYDKLNYYDQNREYKSTVNDENLSLFWQEILKLIRSKKGRDVDFNVLKPEILAIAEKYK